ncbi:MAG: Gfo/Idh/MocA family oxidoreductase [Planctomycetaceae bacterium]|jgi:predicted dehydrogenase|nr:Gfo/Idh/MocA family oxidoreductase [Planctomycetaceae bacterium]
MSARREFLKKTVTITGAATFVPYILSSAQPGIAQAVSDQLRVGVVGLGGMGRGDAIDFSKLADVVALCDVDSEYGIAQAKKNGDINRLNPDTYKDYRKVLERKDIDIISIATVDHWHVKIAIEALMAGKHVFVQKPLTLTIEEGQLIRSALKKYPKLIFDVGTQQRWQRYQFATAALMVRKGVLGKIVKMTADIGPCPVEGPFKKATPPESLDWNFWQGQCKPVEYITKRCHNDFRWWNEYSGGRFTDWGAHHVDFVHWALGLEQEGQGPSTVTPISVTNQVDFKDGYPTADNRFNTCPEFEVSCKMPNDVEMIVCSRSKDGNGILIEGTKGRIHVSRGRIAGKPFEEKWHENVIKEEDYIALAHGKPFQVPEGEWYVNPYHKENFIACIREGGLPISDGFSHVQAIQSCHLCAIAARLNREIKWDPKTEKIIGDDQAAAFIARERRKEFDIPKV